MLDIIPQITELEEKLHSKEGHQSSDRGEQKSSDQKTLKDAGHEEARQAFEQPKDSEGYKSEEDGRSFEQGDDNRDFGQEDSSQTFEQMKLILPDTPAEEMALVSATAAITDAISVEEEAGTGNVLRRHIKDNPRKKKLAKHRLWMDSVQHEYPLPYVPYRIGVYIRYYNQTRHKNYLEKHIQQFTDDIALCKRWTLVDFYIDKGMTAPHMEFSKEWCRLLADCSAGKVNLIVTQKVSNVSSDPDEMALIARLLAAQKPPVGIYFISEDIFTLASYYREDMFDRSMFPAGTIPLPDDELDLPMFYEEQGQLLLEETEPGRAESLLPDTKPDSAGLLLSDTEPDRTERLSECSEEEEGTEDAGADTFETATIETKSPVWKKPVPKAHTFAEALERASALD